MKYTLITNAGTVISFYILACAKVYQQAYGGTLITADILNSQESEQFANTSAGFEIGE